MSDIPAEVSGWTPVGEKVAGYRDAVTDQLQPGPPVADNAAVLRQLLSVAVGTLSVAALYFGQDVLIPITLAVMLAFILSPLVKLLQQARLWRAPAVIIAVLAALGIIGAVGTLIGSQAASLSVNTTQYARAIEAKVELLQGAATSRIQAVTNLVVKPKPTRAAPPVQSPAASPRAAGAISGAAPGPLLVELSPPKPSALELTRAILAPVLGPLETTFIVLIVAIFVLMQKEDLRDRLIRVFGSGDLHRTTMALDDAGLRLSRYFLAQLGINTTFGVIVATGLWLFGIPSPALWGVLAGMCRFVPYVGAFLAAIGPIALGLAIDPGWLTAIFIAAFFVTTEAVLGYIVEPLLYGHSTGLSPVSVIIAAIFWTWLWGPIGLIISTPLTLCFVVLGRHVKALEFFDVLLGDRPALTPVEGFYQRVLADNADEALAQAEVMLGDRDLLTYYDEVVLEALKLAAIDEARGIIDQARIGKMTRTMMSVIDDLGGHDEHTVNELHDYAGATSRLVCMAGRGPFDDAVTAMLVQALDRRGLNPRFVRHQDTSRTELARLDLSDVDIIIVSYLELTGSPAQLRFLIRRLRKKAPQARIIVGLWPDGEAALSDDAIQMALGADGYVGSLSTAVTAAVAFAGDQTELASGKQSAR